MHLDEWIMPIRSDRECQLDRENDDSMKDERWKTVMVKMIVMLTMGFIEEKGKEKVIRINKFTSSNYCVQSI